MSRFREQAPVSNLMPAIVSQGMNYIFAIASCGVMVIRKS